MVDWLKRVEQAMEVLLSHLVQAAGMQDCTLRNAKLSIIKAHRIVVELSAALRGLSTPVSCHLQFSSLTMCEDEDGE